MALPKPFTATDTRGSGSKTNRVNQGEIDSIKTTATTNTMAVVTEYMIDGPTIMRTALKSLVARDIKSPVR